MIEQLPLGCPSFARACINENSEGVEGRCDSAPEFSYPRVHAVPVQMLQIITVARGGAVPLLHRGDFSEIAVAAFRRGAQQTIQPWKAFRSGRGGISTFMNMQAFFNRIQQIVSVSVVFFALWSAVV